MNSSVGHPLIGFSQVAITGVAARLPGADNEDEFWQLLDQGRCTVGSLPPGRWRAERYFHPRASEPGFSYTFAGGYLKAPFDFDPTVFGISPREAAEMDPQQRLLLEVVWSALEDSGIPPSAVSGANIGVYVGASSLDYGNLHTTDPAAIESHFMTGNTLSILSNRISYIYDLRGPSFTVDTACSSSLVAFAEAQAAIASGRIDMAIVGGVNMLLSPMSFIGFARASMLSPTGLCRPFSADGDGYVRAEGAVAMILTRLSTAIERRYPIRAVALASGVNSDGRTSGISLPSMEGQRSLLQSLYGPKSDRAIDPNRLAFVEAHGTGTRVGDPAEAAAIGEALGQARTAPLPIGSVKSNIGHLEPASGLAGLYKAILALEHRQLPRSLHLRQFNPAIDFAALNLALADQTVALPPTGTWLAGVSSFGFGGTNAHVVIRQPDPAELPAAAPSAPQPSPQLLALSAHSRPALVATAQAYAGLIAAGQDPKALANAVAWQRDLSSQRLVLPLAAPASIVAALTGFVSQGELGGGAVGQAPSIPPRIAFVFSGNGCQWAGMGRAAFAGNAAFRRHFRAIDGAFQELAGWSLEAALLDPDLAQRLKLTRVAQPLLFAMQSALVAGLADLGLTADLVLGHSVGEVAAAEASGAISLEEAVRVIYHRSEHQESAFGLGTMAVAGLGAEAANRLILETGHDGLEVAAINSPTSVTLSGPDERIVSFAKMARKRRIVMRVLDLAYPFHSAILAPLRQPLLHSLGQVAAGVGRVPFISTVTGTALNGAALDADYWWRNVREPVQFQAAIITAAAQGAGLFIEIGPRPILITNVGDCLRDAGSDALVMPSLVDKDGRNAEDADGNRDPLLLVAARALALGCRLDTERLFGPAAGGRVRLPAYAWQKKPFQQPATSEALDIYGAAPRHPLIGARLAGSSPEWRNLIDASVVPYLADHRIDGEMVMPGSAFAEMALTVARELWPEGAIGLEDFDLLQWLPLRPDAMQELSVRLSGDTQVVEIWSRPRLGADEWSLCARGRILRPGSPPPAFLPRQSLPHKMTGEQIYAAASRAGVEYGPAFRRVLQAERSDVLIEATLAPIDADAGLASRSQILHPIALDAAFHAMFENIKIRAGERYAYLPVRFGALRVDQDGAIPARARVQVDRETDQSLSISVALYAADDSFIAGLTGGLFRSITLDRHSQANPFFRQDILRLSRCQDPAVTRELAQRALTTALPPGRSDSWLILEAFVRALAFDTVRGLFGGAPVRPEAAPPHDRIADAAWPRLLNLLDHLEAAGLAQATPEGWVLAADSSLPPAGEILRTFAADQAAATAEIVLAAQALAGLGATLQSGQGSELRPLLLEQFESGALVFAPLFDAVRALCLALHSQIAPEPLRLLLAEPSCLGLLTCLTPLVLQGVAVITVVGSDSKRLHHTAARRLPVEGISFELVDEADGTEADLALAMAFGPLFGGDPSLGRAIVRRLAPGGLICAVQPPDSAIFDILLGDSDGWFAASAAPHPPLGRVAAGQDSARLLVSAGFGGIDRLPLPDAAGTLLLAAADPSSVSTAAATAPVLLLERPHPLVKAVAGALRDAGRPLRSAPLTAAGDVAALWSGVAAAATDQGADLLFAAFPGAERGLEVIIGELQTVLAAVQTGGCRLWVLVQGLAGSAAVIDPQAEAILGFVRVAINEYPAVEIRLVDIAVDADVGLAAERLVGLMARPGAEAELLVDATGVSALRTRPGLGRARAESIVPAVRLELRSKGVLSQLDWVECQRRAPAVGEVEVEILASGLNFRDIMLATGLLDDDVLDEGLAGAVFGFECAGRVVAVGDGVTALAIGDAVMGFGRHSFASFTTADARVFTRLPEGLPIEAAATIPVAFLTAWYALVHQARVQPGEWVLIHGAAGGVGLAAIQIARLHGARVAATVSSADKRAVVSLFGAERIYHSRSLAFHDQIHADLGGVDVVLNSLAGDAMLASVKCLKPFGRFVELGKRDYVLNTALGLRPFRRNLTYYGVDLDQLLAANLPLSQRLMGDLVGHFASGDLSPLPYRGFDWFDAGDAFQLMQSAGHVGKLIVRPSHPPVATRPATASFSAAAGAHLVVGGAGGFGFETAAWLVQKGARTVVVASRRGSFEPHLASRVAAIRAAGSQLIAVALDVTDAAAVQTLIHKLQRDHGRVAGVIHAAMVLDDGLIAGLEAPRVRAVLAPKVDGARHLDQATRGLDLNYFVAFSSATTMIGNPGQAVYIAANAYLQGLMRARRLAGLPGLAMAWGAIGDVGVLARDAEVATQLERLSGIVAMSAADALRQLDDLLARPDLVPATVYCALFRPGAALQGLKLLSTAGFSQLFAKADGSDADQVIDLANQIAGKSDIEARSLVAALVGQEVARILRLSAEEIDAARPLDELGMDSLMSLELRMSIETRFGVELPVVAISAGITVNDLATRLIAGLTGGGKPGSTGDVERHLIQQHAPGDIGLEELMAVSETLDERRGKITALL